jgi:PAS domain S-box-containing protein
MGRSLFFTNHLQVLSVVAERRDLRLRDIASEIGITERATQRIIGELAQAGYLARTRVGSRNRYVVSADAPLPQARRQGQTVGQAIALLTGAELSAVADADGRLIAVNPAFCELVGRGQGELIGHSSREFTHPDDIAADDERRRLVAGERAQHTNEKRYIRPDGTVTRVRVRLAGTSDPASGARLVVAYVTDVSGRERHRQGLAEAEERFRSAFDNAPIGMALVAPDGRWLKVNRAVCEITGYSETALLVRSFQEITHPDDLDADLAYVEDVLAGRRWGYHMEKRYYHADGHVIWVMLFVSLVREAGGRRLYFLSQIEDITERKRAVSAAG